MSDTRRFGHLCILASAGSGKTYRLTQRYLSLVSAGEEPGAILASTFTRAAAKEILDRVLARAADAALDASVREAVRRDLGLAAFSETEALTLLERLVRSLHASQIRTIDSFFAGVVRAFSIELGLPDDAAVMEEADAAGLRREAMRKMLDERDPQGLIVMLRALTRGAATRSVVQAIDDVIQDLYEVYRASERPAWETIVKPRAGDRLSTVKLVEAIAQLRATDIPGNDKTVEGHLKACDRAEARDWESFLKAGIASKLAVGETMFNRKPIEPTVLAAYQPVVRHACAELAWQWREQTLATREVLELFDGNYEAGKFAARAMTFGDVTQAMSRAEKLGLSTEIGFRLDATLRHLLLDEMQDTSIAQWRAMRPLAEEIVSQGGGERSFFCVGDAKQSIYGWRGGCPEVLEEMPNLLRGADGNRSIEVETLAKSWRSSPVVMNAVNKVFGSLATNNALREHQTLAKRWQDGFEHHETARTDLAGYVTVQTSAGGGDTAARALENLRKTAEIVQDLYERQPGLSIGVLVRTNLAVARLVHELNRRGIAAAERGGTPVTTAPAVNAVLDAIRMADHPGDTVAAFHVLHSPMGEVVGLKSLGMRNRLTTARLIRRMLMEDGYAATIGRWAQKLDHACDERELRRLMQLIGLGAIHDSRPTLRPVDFLAMAESKAVADAAPSTVKVMNIHQSKGLEFDAVVLTDLDGKTSLCGKSPGVLVEREGATGPIRRVVRYPNELLRTIVKDIDPGVEAMAAAQKARMVQESLCVLYVAMTRARQGLYVVLSPAASEKTMPQTLGGLLRCAFAEGRGDASAVLHEDGDAQWVERFAKSNEQEQMIERWEDGTTIRLREDHEITWDVGETELEKAQSGQEMSPSAMAKSAKAGSLGRLLMLPNDEPLARGSAMHAMLETVEWAETWKADDAALTTLAMRAAERRDEAWASALARELRGLMENGGLRKVLSKREGWRVDRERRFARLGDGSAAEVQAGTIDRLEVREVDGKPVEARVVDYKTDVVDLNEAARVAEGYRVQINAYRKAAAAMLGLEEAKVSGCVVFIMSGKEISLND